MEQKIFLLFGSKVFFVSIHIFYFDKLKKFVHFGRNFILWISNMSKNKKLYGGGGIYFPLFST